MARPVGVTIIAVLSILGGIALLCIGGLGVLGGTALSGQVSAAGGAASGVNSGVLVAFGGGSAVLGVLEIVLGVGLLQLKGWAWMLGIALQVIGVIYAVVQIAVNNSSVGSEAVSIVISAIILYYLFTPKVRAAFGRG